MIFIEYFSAQENGWVHGAAVEGLRGAKSGDVQTRAQNGRHVFRPRDEQHESQSQKTSQTQK